jgi:hypothetical protein
MYAKYLRKKKEKYSFLAMLVVIEEYYLQYNKWSKYDDRKDL